MNRILHVFANGWLVLPDGHDQRISPLFKPAGSPPSPVDYAKPAHVDASVILDITVWITDQGRSKTRVDVH